MTEQFALHVVSFPLQNSGPWSFFITLKPDSLPWAAVAGIQCASTAGSSGLCLAIADYSELRYPKTRRLNLSKDGVKIPTDVVVELGRK